MNVVKAFINSPVGPRTTHFWGPVMNGGFVAQGIYDWNRPAEKISKNMQTVLTVYSCTFIRFAWMVKPRNYLLATMHVTNAFVQGRLLIRRLIFERNQAKAAQQK